MSNVLEIFDPYLPFFVAFISIGLSLYLAIKGVNVWAILIANFILSAIIFPALGLENYNLITQIIDEVFDVIVTLFERMIEAVVAPVRRMLEGIFRIIVFGGD